MFCDDDDDDDDGGGGCGGGDDISLTLGLSVSMQREELGTDFLLEHALSVPMLRPRVPADVLFVLGGWSRDGVCSIMETYDDRVHRWFKVCSLFHFVPFSIYISNCA